MRCFICRLLLIATVIFVLLFVVQAGIDFKGLLQTLASAAALVVLAMLLYELWQHLKQWRRPILALGIGLLGLGAISVIIKTPELQELIASLLRGISLDGALPLVFAVLCIVTYGVLGLAHASSR